MLTQVTVDDIEPIAIGAGILGTGGGGNPYQGGLHLRAVLCEYGPQPVVNPCELPDDARLVVVGSIGAPTVSIEKLPQGQEMSRAIRHLERHVGHAFDAVAIAEIGGANSMQPLIAGRQLGIPTVDGDGMGRAFPEMQMSSFLYESDVSVAPYAMVDVGHRRILVPHTISEKWGERVARNIAVSMGARAALAGYVMSGAEVRATAVKHTLSLAHSLGNAVLASQGNDVPAVVAEMLQGEIIFRGKISDVNRRIVRGFARGNVVFESFDGADELEIAFQNEYLIAWRNGEVCATVPDLICMVTAETGEPVSTEMLRYGTRVVIIAVPAPAELRTAAALKVVGPLAFGYDVPWRPLPGGRIGLPVA